MLAPASALPEPRQTGRWAENGAGAARRLLGGREGSADGGRLSAVGTRHLGALAAKLGAWRTVPERAGAGELSRVRSRKQATVLPLQDLMRCTSIALDRPARVRAPKWCERSPWSRRRLGRTTLSLLRERRAAFSQTICSFSNSTGALKLGGYWIIKFLAWRTIVSSIDGLASKTLYAQLCGTIGQDSAAQGM